MKYISLILGGAICLTGCASISVSEEIPAEPAYISADQRFLENVHIKQSDEYGITYEYKDVRIDEIAYLAAEYCYEQKQRKAVLYDSQLYRNFSRRTTFHCL